jgi:poly(A) polymerase
LIPLETSLARFAAADPLLAGAVSLARGCGCRLLLVGGAVRDLALERAAGDLDFILEGPSGPFLRRLSARLGHRVVTFRKRGIVDHRVRAGDREWDFVECGPRTLTREILRRDFALNAVAFDLLANRLVDPARGVLDLRRRRIRAVSAGVFRDDPLRMLRAVRLRAEIGELSLERRTARWIRRDAALIRRVSPERVKSELDRILSAPRPSASILTLERLGLLTYVLPELDPLRGLAQNRYHHLDAFRHTLAALAAADEPARLGRGLAPLVFAEDPLAPARLRTRMGARSHPPISPARARILRWALLLHDTGKAATRTLGEDGEYHFYLHERPSARIARQTLVRLRASREEASAVETLVALHLRLSIPPAGDLTPRALRRIVRDAGSLTPLLALHTLADKIASRGPAHARTLARLRGASRALLLAWRDETERARRLPRLLNGHDVMKKLDLGPGPGIGAILARVEDLQASRELETRAEALAWLARLKDPATRKALLEEDAED